MKNLNLIGTKESMSVVSNPFKKESITSINLEYEKKIFKDYWSWRAIVRFTNGNTSGSQAFEVTDLESENAFADITKQIQNFINTI